MSLIKSQEIDPCNKMPCLLKVWSPIPTPLHWFKEEAIQKGENVEQFVVVMTCTFPLNNTKGDEIPGIDKNIKKSQFIQIKLDFWLQMSDCFLSKTRVDEMKVWMFWGWSDGETIHNTQAL